MREVFKSAKGYEGIYSVSNLGRVKREKSVAKKGTGNYQRDEHIVKQRKNNKGYYVVDLYVCNVRHQVLVHRLVAQTFLKNPMLYPCVNHKDENPQNNCVENLEWCTQKYNMNYGTVKKRIAGSNGKKVVQYSRDGKQVAKYISIMDAQRKTGISNGSIGDCLHNRRKSAGGFLWEYAQ
jgi:hypothetical protein